MDTVILPEFQKFLLAKGLVKEKSVSYYAYWVSKFIECGYVDTFRHFTKDGGHYTWWDYYTGARARDVGWRIDYFFVTENLLPKLKKAFILKDVMGSDHCPVGIELKN